MPKLNRKPSTVDLLMQVYIAENAFEKRISELEKVVRNLRAKFANDPVPEQFQWVQFPNNAWLRSRDHLMPGRIVPVSGYIDRSSIQETTKLTNQTRIRLGSGYITVEQLKMSTRELAKSYRKAIRAERLKRLRADESKRLKEIEEAKEKIRKLQNSLNNLENQQKIFEISENLNEV